MIKKCFFLLLGFSLYVGLEQLIELSTHGFWVKRIEGNHLPYQEAFAIPPLSQEEMKRIHEIVGQPFYLLGSGSECFAFLSEDENYVIKLFKLDLARPVYVKKGVFGKDHSKYANSFSPEPSSYRSLPSFVRNTLNRMRGMRDFRLFRTFKSVLLAYRGLAKETALVYVHLNPSSEFQEPLTLYDSSHIAHQIDLNQVRFVIQKKATPFASYVHKLMETGTQEAIRIALSSLLDLAEKRCKEGLVDRDMIARNFGFVDGKAIEIDTGSFIPCAKMKEGWVYRQALYFAILEMKSWLKQESPELADFFIEIAKKRIESSL